MRRKGTPLLLLLLSVFCTGILYAFLWRFVREGEFFDFMCDRGYYQHASTALFFYGLILLGHRWWVFRSEGRALEEIALPSEPVIRPAEAVAVVGRFPAAYRRTLLGKRLAELLQGYAWRDEIGPLLSRLGAKDREELERSASLLSWVRSLPPVIGLLGTLDGLRGGMGQIAEISNLKELDELRSRLQGFAQNAATAFDTTLLGIICALVLSAFIFVLRKTEDGHLTEVDKIAHRLSLKFERESGLMHSLEMSLQMITDQTVRAFREKMETAVQDWLQIWKAQLDLATRTVLQPSGSGDGTSRELGEALRLQTQALVSKLEAIERALAEPRRVTLKVAADQEKESYELGPVR